MSNTDLLTILSQVPVFTPTFVFFQVIFLNVCYLKPIKWGVISISNYLYTSLTGDSGANLIKYLL